MPAASAFVRELHPNGVFGERTCQDEVFVDRCDEDLKRSREFLRIAVSNEVGQVRTKRGENFVVFEIEPATDAEQDVRFPSKGERSGFLEDFESDVLRDVALDERCVSEKDGDDLTFTTQALEGCLAKRILPTREFRSATCFVTSERSV